MLAATTSSSAMCSPVALIGPPDVGVSSPQDTLRQPMREHPLAQEYRRAGWWRPESVVSRFHQVCATGGDRIAIIDGERRLTFAEVRALAGRLAGHLPELG